MARLHQRNQLRATCATCESGVVHLDITQLKEGKVMYNWCIEVTTAHPLPRGVSVLFRPLDAVLVGLVCLVVPAHK